MVKYHWGFYTAYLRFVGSISAVASLTKMMASSLVFVLCLVNADAAASNKPLLVSSIRPLTLIAEDLAADWLEVRQLLADKQEPHHVSLSMSQRKLMDRADLIVWVGDDLETSLVRPLASIAPQRQLSLQQLSLQQLSLQQLSLQQLSLNKSEEQHREKHREQLREQELDAHRWLQPMIVATFYTQLAARLTELYPNKAENIQQKLVIAQQRLARAVAQAEKAFSQTLSRQPQGKIIVDHQAYGHYSDFFQLPMAGALVNEQGLAVGAKGFAALMAKEQVVCVVVEQLPPPPRAQKLAEVLAVDLVAINPLGQNPLSQNLGRKNRATAASDYQTEGYAGFFNYITAGFLSCYR